MADIYEIYGDDAHEMTVALMERANVADMIPRGAGVALKPNLLMDTTPELGAVTHPGAVSGAVSYLRDHGIERVSVIEGAWAGALTGPALKAAGYVEMLDRLRVPFVDLKRDETRAVVTPMWPMQICRAAIEADFLIDMPVLKAHQLTAMTCALKNLKGCTSDAEKRRGHADGLHESIAALAATLRPRLTIVDGICGDLDSEAGGTPVHANTMYLCEDPVAADAHGCALMGIDPARVRYIGLASEWGAGEARVDEVIRLNRPQDAPPYPAPTGAVERLTRRVAADGACSACMAALIRALRAAESPDGPDIFIGRGFQGKRPSGLGVGRCCQGASRCVPGCPPTAAQIVRALIE